MSPGQLKVGRLLDLAFFPGRAPRSPQYREGCAAALEFRILGVRMEPCYTAGSCAADAWAAGVEEGHAIWRTTVPAQQLEAMPSEQGLLRAWHAMDDRSQRFNGALAPGQARHAAPALHLVR